MIGWQKKNKGVFKGYDLDNFSKDECIKHFEGIRVHGIYVLVAVYKGPIITKTLGGIDLPDSSIDYEEEFVTDVGLFIKQGNEAYTGSQFPSGPYAAPGDWVHFDRGACKQRTYNGRPYIIAKDYTISAEMDNPSYVGR